MSAFTYQNGIMHADAVSLADIAKRVPTPFYCYSISAVEARYREFAEAFADQNALICYAMKANSSQAVVRSLAQLGAGADLVSGGELKRALAGGIDRDKIIFSGVGKTDAEIVLALEENIYQFNTESEPELERISALAHARDLRAPITIRVNPDIDAGTHKHITTGTSENKFGIPWTRVSALYEKAANLPGLDVQGVAMHIGSQLFDISALRRAYERLVGLARDLNGRGFDIRRIDFGGGMGIVYRDETPLALADYAAMVRDVVGDFPGKIIFEPGRYIVGNAGALISRVVYTKDEARRFVILDAAMNDLIRPALYEAWHDFLPVAEPATDAPWQEADIVGPICESTDRFAEHRPLPPLHSGDLIAAMSAGAYSAVMASTYNSRPLPAEVVVKGDRFAISRKTESIEELIAKESIPDWL